MTRTHGRLEWISARQRNGRQAKIPRALQEAGGELLSGSRGQFPKPYLLRRAVFLVPSRVYSPIGRWTASLLVVDLTPGTPFTIAPTLSICGAASRCREQPRLQWQ